MRAQFQVRFPSLLPLLTCAHWCMVFAADVRKLLTWLNPTHATAIAAGLREACRLQSPAFCAALPSFVVSSLLEAHDIMNWYAKKPSNVQSVDMHGVARAFLLRLHLAEAAKAACAADGTRGTPPLIALLPGFGDPKSFVSVDSQLARDLIRFFERTRKFKPGKLAAEIMAAADKAAKCGQNGGTTAGLEAMFAFDCGLIADLRARGFKIAAEFKLDGIQLHVPVTLPRPAVACSASKKSGRSKLSGEARSGPAAQVDFLADVCGLYSESCLPRLGACCLRCTWSNGILTHVLATPCGRADCQSATKDFKPFHVRGGDPGMCCFSLR